MKNRTTQEFTFALRGLNIVIAPKLRIIFSYLRDSWRMEINAKARLSVLKLFCAKALK
jgi:hypothetical protein